jgi:hypothetical protein
VTLSCRRHEDSLFGRSDSSSAAPAGPKFVLFRLIFAHQRKNRPKAVSRFSLLAAHPFQTAGFAVVAGQIFSSVPQPIKTPGLFA